MKELSCFLLTLFLLGCSSGSTSVNPTPATKSSEKSIISSPIIVGLSDVSVAYEPQTLTYTFSVPNGTNVKALKLDFRISSGATISPDPATAQDYTNPVKFKLTAEDGSSQTYTFTVAQKTPVATSKNCLIAKLEDANSGEYISFQYDAKGRVSQMQFEFTYTTEVKRFKTNVVCSYDGDTGDLVEAKVTGFLDNGGVSVFRPIYENGKLVRISTQDNGGGPIIVFPFAVDSEQHITQYTTSTNDQCFRYAYSNNMLTKISSCTNGFVYDTMEYDGTIRHFLAGQTKYPGFLAFFYLYTSGIDDTGIIHQFYGSYMPAKASHFFNVDNKLQIRRTISCKTNSDAFPTEMDVKYETALNTDFPRSITYNYKLTYASCQ